MVKVRDSRIELARIVAMILIVMHHLSFASTQYIDPTIIKYHINFVSTPILVPNSLEQLLNIIGVYFYRPYGKIGVALFVLITGYFSAGKIMTVSKSFKKVWMLWTEVWFYGALTAIFEIINPANFFGSMTNRGLIRQILTDIFPFSLGTLWFFQAFVMLMVLAPFITAVTSKISKQKLSYLIVAVTIFSSLAMYTNTNFNVGQGNALGYIISPFLIGIYIKKFGTSIKHPLLWLMISLAFTYCLMIFWVDFTYGPMPLVSAVLLFVVMMNFKPFYSKAINKTASVAFAVYIVHELFNLVHHLPMNETTHLLYLNSILYPVFAILTYGLVFVFDTLRQQAFRLFKVELLGNKVMNGLRKLFY